jgi:hypothetical protein
VKFSRRGQRFPVWFGVSRCSRMDAWARGTPRQVGHAEMPQSCAGTPSRHPREWRSFLGGALTAGRPRGTEWTATERRGRRPSVDTEDHSDVDGDWSLRLAGARAGPDGEAGSWEMGTFRQACPSHSAGHSPCRSLHCRPRTRRVPQFSARRADPRPRRRWSRRRCRSSRRGRRPHRPVRSRSRRDMLPGTN